MLQYFLLPIILIPVSCMIFRIIIKEMEPDIAVPCLKYYSILLMPLAIEALIRSMDYVRVMGSRMEIYIILSFLVMSILVQCFCILIIAKKFAKHITRNIYFGFALLLLSMFIIFPFSSFDNSYVSLDASSQIVSVWGCIAAALYFISEYYACKESPDEEIVKPDKKLLPKKALFFCAMLELFVFLIMGIGEPEYTNYSDFFFHYKDVIKVYDALNPGTLAELSTEEAVDITDLLIEGISEIPEYQIISKKYKRIVSVVLKNRTYSLQYNVEAWLYFHKGVPWFGWDSHSGESIEDHKKYLIKTKDNYNSPNLDSPYDGTGEVFFRYVLGPLN